MESHDYSRLQEEQAKEINLLKEKIKQWEQFTADYEAVQERLQTLPKKLTHDVMVPFGSIAFMPGELYHTNEVLVLLGDNWFTECTADHAWGIAERRKKYTVEKLCSEQKNLKEMIDRFDLTREVQETNEDFIEIREDYDPEQEKEWKKAHKKKQKEEKGKQNKELQTHDDVWARLEELEEQERIDNEREQIFSCDDDNQLDHHDIRLSEKPRVQSIVFKHTDETRSGNRDRIRNQENEHVTEDSNKCLYRTPGDIYRVPANETDHQQLGQPLQDYIPQVTKKKTVKFSSDDRDQDVAVMRNFQKTFDSSTRCEKPEIKQHLSSSMPFTGHVVERASAPVNLKGNDETEPKRKVSKFKAEKYKSAK